MGEQMGFTTIRLSWQQQAETSLKIIDPVMDDLHTVPINANLPINTVTQYHAILYLPIGQSFDITNQAMWTSSRADILSVIASGDQGGQAWALQPGTATIKATYLSPNNRTLSHQTTATVTNSTLKQLVLAPETADIPIGIAQTYSLTAIFSDGSKKDVSATAHWQVANTAVAEVMTAATIKGLNTGDISDYTSKVIWSLDNFNIATVESGVIQGKSPGSTTIRANFETVNASVPVTVTDITTTTP